MARLNISSSLVNFNILKFFKIWALRGRPFPIFSYFSNVFHFSGQRPENKSVAGRRSPNLSASSQHLMRLVLSNASGVSLHGGASFKVPKGPFRTKNAVAPKIVVFTTAVVFDYAY